MEARVTTATRRLRRASVAGLATIVTAGVAVIASGGTAMAFVVGTAAAHASVTSASSATLNVGGSNQALGDLTLTFPANASALEYSAGEEITFTLKGAGPTHPINDTALSSFNTAAFSAAPTVTADNAVVAPAAGVALATVTKTNDSFVLTFNHDAPENATATNFTITGLKVNLGSTVSPGQTISILATATTGTNLTPFWNGAAASATQSTVVGTIPQVNLTTSKVAVSAPAATGVALGVISIKDVAGGSIHNGDALVLTLSGGAFTTVPVATGTPAVGTITIVGGALHFTASAASVAGNTITLTGALITAGGAGANTATLTDTTAPFGINPTAKVAAAVAQHRLGGADRYGTGSIVFAAGGFNAKSVVLTSGANFPDALSAQFLAAALSANLSANVGVLTTDPSSLSTQTRTQLVAAAPGIDTVYILGGTAAVSANVAAQVANLHVGNVPTAANLNVVRIGGADRFATNNAADLYLGAIGGSGHAFVATGNNFADALAIGPAVYATGDPLILTDGTTLSASAQSTLQSLGISTVTIVGGTAAVAATVATAITNLGITIDQRLAGADRTLTAAAIATWELDTVANGGLAFDEVNVFIARGDNFADALVAGPLAGLNGEPILLTGDPNTLGAGIPSVLGSSTTTTDLTALGLTGAVSVATLNAAAASLG
jgi:putative cell wall-binding protein